MKRIVFISLLILILRFLIINKCKVESFTNAKPEDMQIIWDNKVTTINNVIENLKKEWNACGFNELILEPSDFTAINSRKKLIESLPVTKMLPRLDYNMIKCFVNKFDPTNYVVTSKITTIVPKVLKLINIVIVNNMLYQSTQYGMFKYQVPKLSELSKNNSLNASIEVGILNDYNSLNKSNNPIYNLNGRILQKRESKIFDLKTNDEYEFININNKIVLLNKKDKQQIKEQMVDVGGIIELKIQDIKQLKTIDSKSFLPFGQVQTAGTTNNITGNNITGNVEINKTTNIDEINKILDTLVSVIEYGGIIYICQSNIVRPLSNWVNKLNSILNKNKFTIKGVIPHYYLLNNIFNYSIIFIFNDDFCVILNKDDLSEVMDVKNFLGITFNQEIPDVINCNDLQVILEQMTKANVITNDKSDSILKKYSCKN